MYNTHSNHCTMVEDVCEQPWLLVDPLGNYGGWPMVAAFALGFPDLSPTNYYPSANTLCSLECSDTKYLRGVCVHIHQKQLDAFIVEGKTNSPRCPSLHYLHFWAVTHKYCCAQDPCLFSIHLKLDGLSLSVFTHQNQIKTRLIHPVKLGSHHVLISVSANTALLAERKEENSSTLNPLCSVNSFVSSQPSQKHIPHRLWQILTRYWVQFYSQDSK